MATGRASARHLIECLRNCLLGEAADALLHVAEAHARRLDERAKRDGDGFLPRGWLDGLPADDGGRAAEAPAARAGRRRALLAALDRAAAVLAPGADGEADIEPEAASARLAAAEFGLDGLDAAVLLLALRCGGAPPLGALANDALDRLKDPAEAVAALLEAEPREVRRRLAPGAPLFASGLLAPGAARYPLFGEEYQDGALELAASLPAATARASEGRDAWVAALLGRPCPPELDWADFAHVAEAADVAVRLLRGAARSGAAGINVLLHGPVGTGKTRLAAAIAARAGLVLYALGEAGEDGDEPSRTERASALRLALALTASRRDAALLFDEGEDLLEAAPRQSEAREDRSKAWLNRVLEDNPTPVLWTINDLHRVDRATLRRMSLLVEVGVPEEAAVRERVWGRVLGLEGLALGEGAAARLAARWASAPAICSSAARAARLSGGGEAEVEAAMRGYAQVLGGGAPRADRGDDPAAPPDLDLLACDADIPALAARLAAPNGPKNWALLVAGPAGSGRSTLAVRLAAGTGLPVVRRRGADLTGAPSGDAARALAAAFAEARAKQAALVLDGIDGVAADRGAPGACDAALDALLAEVDGHPLPLVCVAGLPLRLDRAALRRFTLTVRLGALGPEKAALAFRRVLGAEPPPGAVPEGVTIGDFAAVRLRRDLLGGDTDAATLRAWLAQRAEAGGAAPREVGFRVVHARGGGSRDDRAGAAAAR